MAEKRSYELKIAGEVVKFSGKETEEHVNKVAKMVNDQFDATYKSFAGRNPAKSYVMTLVSVNLADQMVRLIEYVNAARQKTETVLRNEKKLTERIERYEQEMLGLENEIINLQEKLKEAEEKLNG